MRIIFPNRTSANPLVTKILKQIPLGVFVFSILSPIMNFVFARFGWHFLSYRFGLSLEGIASKHYWQFFTYSFVNSTSSVFSQGLLIKATLMYFVQQTMLNLFIKKIGNIKFILFWFMQILSVALFSLFLMYSKSLGNTVYGILPFSIGLTTVGIFLDPQKKIGLPPLPIYFSVKWIALIIVGFVFSVLISQNQLITVFNSIISIGVAVLFCRMERIPNPYISELSF
ncbi:MAG: hypothetical protein RSB82_03585 [Victivallaceae bacterium]